MEIMERYQRYFERKNLFEIAKIDISLEINFRNYQRTIFEKHQNTL